MPAPIAPDTEDTIEAEAAAVLAAAGGVLDYAAAQATRLTFRRRRLLRALYDLGLLDIVGPDWVGIGDAGFAFAELSDRASDRLTCALEDIAADREGGSSRRRRLTGELPGQLAFDV